MKKLLLILGIAALGFTAWAEDVVYQPIGPFGTLNDRDSAYAIPANKSQSLLNVNITEGGKSIKKREGYGVSATLSISTSPVHGVYTFFDSNGNTVDLFANDRYLSASVSGATTMIGFSVWRMKKRTSLHIVPSRI